MQDENRIRITLSRLIFLLPLLALPFAPAIGKLGAELVISITTAQNLLQ